MSFQDFRKFSSSRQNSKIKALLQRLEKFESEANPVENNNLFALGFTSRNFLTFHDNLAFSRLHTLAEDDDYKLTAEPDGNLFKLWFTFDGITELEDQALWGHIGTIFGDSGCDALAEGVYEGIGAGGTICMKFNGTNKYVQVLPSEHLTINNRPQFSIFIRFKVDDVTQDQTLFEKYDDLSGSYAYKAIITNRRVVFMVNVNGTGYTKVNSANLVNNTWYDVWMRRDNITLTVYVNGSDATAGLNSAGFSEEGFSSGGFTTRFPPVEFDPIPTGTGVGTSLLIGVDGNLQKFFKGYIQDFRIWSKLVTPTEITNQWTNKVSISNIAFERCAVVGYAPIRSARRRSFTETITFVDSITATYKPTNPKLRSISNSVTFSDSITPLKNVIKPANVNDTFGFADAISLFRGATFVKVGAILKSTQTSGLPFTVNHSTEIGFRPKFMFFWGSNANAYNTFQVDSQFFIGFSDGTNNYATCAASDDDNTSTDTAKGFYDSAILCIDDDENLLCRANCTFSDTGFSLRYITNASNHGEIINFIALGGSTITNVKVGTFAQPATANGLFSVTDVGFLSDAVFLLPTQFTTVNSKSVNSGLSFGVMNKNEVDMAISITDQDNVSVSASRRIMRENRSIALLGAEPTGIHTMMKMANLLEMTSTGFDLDYLTNEDVGGTAGLCAYAAIQGIKTHIGRFTVSAGATGIRTITSTSIDFKPLLLMFISHGTILNTSSTPSNDAKISIGAVVDSLNRRVASMHSVDASDASIAVDYARSNTSFVLFDANVSSASSTIRLAFDISSIQTGGFTINTTLNTLSSSVDIYYIAIA
jgi:hypothetical protein